MGVEDQGTPKAENSWRHWVAVLGAALAFFCSVGYLNAFGVFQAYYQGHQLSHKSAFDISWLGSFSIFCTFGGSPIAGMLADKICPMILLAGGSIGTLVAVFMTSLCTQYWQLFLAQSLLLGLSMSFVYCPPMATVTCLFRRHRGLALGLTIGGSSAGGVVWPIMLEQLLTHRGLSFGLAIRIIGFTMLPLLGLATACLALADMPDPVYSEFSLAPCTEGNSIFNAGSEGDKKRETEMAATGTVTAPPVPRKAAALSIATNKMFVLLCSGLAICYLGMLSPLFYVTSYATHRGLSTELSFYLASVINAASFFGRVLPGFLADRYGAFNLCILAVFSSGLVAFCWTAAKTAVEVTIWTVVYEFTSGAIMSLQGACAAHVASQDSHGTAMGFLMGSVALTALFGTPISGQFVEHYGYLAQSIFSGATLVAGSVLVAWARFILDRRLAVAK